MRPWSDKMAACICSSWMGKMEDCFTWISRMVRRTSRHSTAHLMIHAYMISVSHNLNDFPCVTLLENILMDLFFRNKNIGAYVLFLNNDSPSKSLSHLSF